MSLKIRDLQFARFLLNTQVDLDPGLKAGILNLDINILRDQGPEGAQIDNQVVSYSNPSSVVKFLFTILLETLQRHARSPEQKDKLGLVLLAMCNEYVYGDYDPPCGPVLISYEKMAAPTIAIKELFEPLVDNIHLPKLLMVKSPVADSCQIVRDSGDLSSLHGLPRNLIKSGNFPLILVNSAIQNRAAILSDVIFQTLSLNFGFEKSVTLIRELLFVDSQPILSKMVTALRILEGDPSTIVSFIDLLVSSIAPETVDCNDIDEIKQKIVRSDSYLSRHVKLADDAYYTPDVRQQWTDWGIMVGLIEKQLEPARGSMWPATKQMKPFDDRRKKMIVDKAKRKGKQQLNFAELLEVSRDLYNTKAVQPGELVETLLKEDRVWK